MKKTLLLMLTAILLTSCKLGEENQSVQIDKPEEVKQKEEKVADVADQDFIDGMTGKIFHNYLEIKMALSMEDSEQVSAVAKNMADSFEEERKDLKDLAEQISKTSSIEDQRKLFASFTDKAGDMFEEALSGGTIYKKYCPMAFNNKGAYWYADVKKDKNPYFGDKMPNCGEIGKTITK